MLPFLTRTLMLRRDHLMIFSKPDDSLKISPTAVPWRIRAQHVCLARRGSWHPVHRAGLRASGPAHRFDGHLGSLVVASEPGYLLGIYCVSGSVVGKQASVWVHPGLQARFSPCASLVSSVLQKRTWAQLEGKEHSLRGSLLFLAQLSCPGRRNF